MPEISDCRCCSSEEIHCLKKYLKKSTTPWLVCPIDQGASVSKCNVKPLSEIGRLRTIWAELGGIRSENQYNSEKFLVRDVVDVLLDERCTDHNGF